MPYFVDNETAKELARNHMLMKKIKKINSIAFFVYLIGGILMMAYAFTSMVGLSWDWIPILTNQSLLSTVSFLMIVTSILICPLSFYLTYRASLLYHSLSALITISLQIAYLIFMIILKNVGFFNRIPIAFYIAAIYSIICIAVGSVNFWAVIKYHWLEDQEGFPQFNPRYEEYKEHKHEREIMDPYQLRINQLQRQSNGEMTDLGTTQDELETYEKVHIPSEMDSI